MNMNMNTDMAHVYVHAHVHVMFVFVFVFMFLCGCCYALSTTTDIFLSYTQRQKIFNKKTFKAIKPFYATGINTYASIGDPPFFLTVLSQPLGHGGSTSFCTSALLLFQCVVKLILLTLSLTTIFVSLVSLRQVI